MGSLAPDSTIVKNEREHPPSSYSLKINKLSQLTLDKYESRWFLYGGYNWRLVIYPKGNENDNGRGFISMYVEFDNTSLSSTPPMEVLTYLTFFVYNKKENKYFSIQGIYSCIQGDSRSRADGKWLSIFLSLAGSEILKADEKIYVRARLQVIDPRGSNHFTETINNWHAEKEKSWGFSQWLSLAKLRETYLDLEDTLTVESEFDVVSLTKHSS